MTLTAKIFTNGRSQAVRLPAAYRFDANEVFIRQDSETGDVILSRKPTSWDNFFTLLEKTKTSPGFLSKKERKQTKHKRDPFEGWKE